MCVVCQRTLVKGKATKVKVKGQILGSNCQRTDAGGSWRRTEAAQEQHRGGHRQQNRGMEFLPTNCNAAVLCCREVVCDPAPKVLIISLQGLQGCDELPLFFQLPGTQAFYKLICFICHIGTVNGYVARSGHYDAYMIRKSSVHPKGDKWYLSDDKAKGPNTVWELKTREIRTGDKPYLCFFDLMTKPPTQEMMQEKFLRARTGKGRKN